MPKIRVHEKALAHLTRGLYRSPASALRELVSNAWDANATRVTISTNYPNFYQISVQDNGDGFTCEEFERLMRGGIGNSEKRSDGKPLIHDRPMIGRLGIGLLGVAQICLGFKISSKTANGEAFKAQITLTDLIKPKLDTDDPNVVSKSSTKDEDSLGETVNVGTYEILDNSDLESMKKGTTIIADDIHPNFTKSFQESLPNKKSLRPPGKWIKAVNILSSVDSLQELGDYWRLLWELSVSSPIPYISKRALPYSLVSVDQARLESYKFDVFVDGIKLGKPVYLHGNPGGYTRHEFESTTKKIYGKPFSFHGYILVQEGKQIKPDELRGILVRIKNVGIGYYDGSLLDYNINQGPRSRWVTGEIYVQEGLEDALNIDRDSFNRFHPEFKDLQKAIHDVLSYEIFPKVYKKIEERSQARSDLVVKKRDKVIRRLVSEGTGKSVKFVTDAARMGDGALVKLKKSKGKIELETAEDENFSSRKSNRQLTKAVLSLYEVASLESSPEKRRELFTKLLQGLLNEW